MKSQYIVPIGVKMRIADKDGNDDKKPDGTRGFQAAFASQTAIMGRGVLDGRLFGKYGGKTWR